MNISGRIFGGECLRLGLDAAHKHYFVVKELFDSEFVLLWEEVSKDLSYELFLAFSEGLTV